MSEKGIWGLGQISLRHALDMGADIPHWLAKTIAEDVAPSEVQEWVDESNTETRQAAQQIINRYGENPPGTVQSRRLGGTMIRGTVGHIGRTGLPEPFDVALDGALNLGFDIPDWLARKLARDFTHEEIQAVVEEVGGEERLIRADAAQRIEEARTGEYEPDKGVCLWQTNFYRYNNGNPIERIRLHKDAEIKILRDEL